MGSVPWLSEDRVRLEAFRRGERATLAEVYRVYAPGLGVTLGHGFTFQSGGERYRFAGFRAPFDLDDALQETFLRAFAQRPRLAYDGIRPFRTYLAAIARNLVIDRFRQEQRTKRLCERLAPGDESVTDEPPTSPETGLVESQLRGIVARFKQTCSAVDRELIELRFEQSVPRARVSELTGLSAMQIRTRERKIRRALWAHLVDQGYGPSEGLVVLLLVTLFWGSV